MRGRLFNGFDTILVWTNSTRPKAAWNPSWLLAALLALIVANAGKAAIQYSGGTYSQNFDGLASSGTSETWVNDSTLSGWSLFNKLGAALDTQVYNIGDGSSTGARFYSFGSSSSGERALGGIGSESTYFGSPTIGAVAGYIAAAIQNKSGSTYTSFVLQFVGEQWRNGGTAAAQTMEMEYGFGATFGAINNWFSPGGNFNYASPVHTTTAAAVDGNVAGKVPGLGGTVSGISWVADQTLWIRWVERNDTGNDHGLAIDDFSITTVPEPVSVALAIFGGIGATVWGVRRLINRR